MRIDEYPSVSELANDDKFIIQTGGGTKKASLEQVAKEIIANVEEDFDIVTKHKNTFRGKNLGTSFTNDQLQMIKNGTFEDLYVGDYWVYGNIIWRIADINYVNVEYDDELNQSETKTRNHLVIVPDKPLVLTKYNDTDKAVYINSYLFKTIIPNILSTKIYPFFNKNNIIPYRTLIPSSASFDGGDILSWVWYDIIAMDLPMLLITGSTSNKETSMDRTIFTGQLSLFRLNSRLINPAGLTDIDGNESNGIWLSTYVGNSSNTWTTLNLSGRITGGTPKDDSKMGSRPFFLVG